MSPRPALAVVALALLTLGLLACAGSDGSGGRLEFGMGQLEASVETETVGFLTREGSVLHGSLERFLGPKLATKVERGSAICRRGSKTPSISNPGKFPFACIVRASADGQGLEVEITLGFVGLEADGRCWHAANERVAVTTTAPELIGRRAALRPVNQIAGCI
jgi:hypothetical protein